MHHAGRGFIGAKLACPTDLAMAILRRIYNHATPEKLATGRRKHSHPRKKLNACVASASMRISNRRNGEKAGIRRYAQKKHSFR
jgi:hypothetical protein